MATAFRMTIDELANTNGRQASRIFFRFAVSPNSSWLLISRQQRHLASKFRQRCLQLPTS